MPPQPFKLRYRLFKTPKDFQDAVAGVSADTNCAIILDLMQPGGNSPENVGDVIFESLSQRLKKRVHLLTAHAGKIQQHIVTEVGVERIWSKPPSSDFFCKSILKTLDISSGEAA